MKPLLHLPSFEDTLALNFAYACKVASHRLRRARLKEDSEVEATIAVWKAWKSYDPDAGQWVTFLCNHIIWHVGILKAKSRGSKHKRPTVPLDTVMHRLVARSEPPALENAELAEWFLSHLSPGRAMLCRRYFMDGVLMRHVSSALTYSNTSYHVNKSLRLLRRIARNANFLNN